MSDFTSSDLRRNRLKLFSALPLSQCLLQAISKGVPELGIPPNDPLHARRDLEMNVPSFLGGK